MLLKDVKLRTPLMQKAIRDEIKTLDQYTSWLIGYESGYAECHKNSMDTITKNTKGKQDEKKL